MKNLLRLAVVVFALGLLVASALGAWWVVGDKTRIREAMIGGAAQRDLSLAVGQIDGGLVWKSLLPEPALVLHDVMLADAGQTKPFTAVPLLRVTLSPFGIVRALLHHDIIVHDLFIDGATVTQPLHLLSLLNGQFTLRHIVADEMVVIAAAEAAPPQTITLHGLTIDAGPPARIKLAGIWGGLPMALDLQAESLADLRAGLRQKISGDGEISGRTLEFAADYSRRPLNDANWNLFDALTISVDGQIMTGHAALAFAAKPQIAATLNAQRWVIGNDAAPVPPAEKTATQLFGNMQLPWDMLGNFDAAGSLSVTQIVQHDRALGPAYVQAQVLDNVATANIIMQPTGSKQPLRLDLKAISAERRVSAVLSAPQLDLTSLLIISGQVGTDVPASPLRAPVMLSAVLTGQGNTPHELAATASGRIGLQAAGGQLDVTALPDAARRALDFVFGPEKLAQASLSCLKTDIVLTGGVAQPSTKNFQMGMTSNLVDIAGTGTIDLNAEQMNLGLVAAPLVPPLAGLTVPLTIVGPLQNPGLGADTTSTLNQLGGQMAGNIASTLVGSRLGKTIGNKAGALTSGLVGAVSGAPVVTNVVMPPNACKPAPDAPATDAAAIDGVPEAKNLFNLISPQMQAEIDASRERLMEHLQGIFGPLLQNGSVAPQ